MQEEDWNAETCLARKWGDLDKNPTYKVDNGTALKHEYCPPIWDGLSCWGPALAGTTASNKCPALKGSDTTKTSSRLCSSLAKWLDRDGIPGALGWTNYTSCITPEIRDVLEKLGSNDDAQKKINIAENTRFLEFVGLTLSFLALLLSLYIFYRFRVLRNRRTRIHCNLFIAMLIQVGIRLVVYTDQAITRFQEFNEDSNNLEDFSTNEGATVTQRRGIDNTPIICEASYVMLEYAQTAMFMWTFVEGLHLRSKITVTVFENKISTWTYPWIGWVFPIPLVLVWAIVTHIYYGKTTCWWGYNFTWYFWIIEGPRFVVLIANFGFLLSILRTLVMRLKRLNSTDTQLTLKAVKAALLLMPLLGITNFLNIIPAPLEESPVHFAVWSYTTHLLTSFQGFILSFLYCFTNGEVQTTIRKFVRIRLVGTSSHHTLNNGTSAIAAHHNQFGFISEKIYNTDQQQQ